MVIKILLIPVNDYQKIASLMVDFKTVIVESHPRFIPPFLSESEGVYRAKRSIRYAFSVGVKSCTIIPVRPGNGALDALAADNYFEQPDIRSLEEVIEYGIELNKGLVFSDLWDIDKFSSCRKCLKRRKERLHRMNLDQVIFPKVNCSCAD